MDGLVGYGILFEPGWHKWKPFSCICLNWINPFWSCYVRIIPSYPALLLYQFSLYLWYDLFHLTSIESKVCLKKKNYLFDMVWYGMVWYGMICYGMIWYDMVWHDMLWFELWIPPFWSCDAHFIPQGIFWWISVSNNSFNPKALFIIFQKLWITVSIQMLFQLCIRNCESRVYYLIALSLSQDFSS